MGGTLTKTVWQYTEPLPEETMAFLRGIASDYNKVKNSIYKRYSGIKSLGRLTPVYDIMSEMRHSGIRTQLGLPSAYFDPAVIDAVADIKGMWGMLKKKIGILVTANENLSSEDKMYLRTVLRLDKVYAAVLCHETYELPRNAEGLDIDTERLNSLLCRLTRKYLAKPSTGSADYFSIAPCGYTYRNGMLCIASRIPGKRIALPLKMTIPVPGRFGSASGKIMPHWHCQQRQGSENMQTMKTPSISISVIAICSRCQTAMFTDSHWAA